MNSTARQVLTGLRAIVVLTILLGIVYPLAVTLVGQLAFHDRANGQFLSRGGEDVGSAIIGQQFSQQRLFHSRPSANDYDGLASAASNLGPSNPDLIKDIDSRRATIAKAEGVSASAVPADAVTASGSGLDPYISPEYAAIQIARVAAQNGIAPSRIRSLVSAATDGRQLGFLGEPKVNVLRLNLAVQRATGA